MDPITMGAILGGSQLLSGLLGLQAQKEMEAEAAKRQGIKDVFQMQQQSLAQEQAAKQSALSDLIAAYRGAL